MTDVPNPTPQPAPQPDGGPAAATVSLDARAMAIAVYALYLIAFANGLTAIAGVIIAYVARKNAPEWLQSHFTFQIRTFWIGLVACIVGVLTIWVLGLGILILVATGLWFLVRAVAGLGQLLNSKPYPNPDTWLI